MLVICSEVPDAKLTAEFEGFIPRMQRYERKNIHSGRTITESIFYVLN